MPEVVLVHGAWHGAWCWERVVEHLDRLGVASTAVELPLEGLAADVEAVRRAILAAGPGSVVVGHSYGGLVITEAAAGVVGIERLVYIAAHMLDVDEDRVEILVRHRSPVLAALQVTDEGTVVDPARAREVFYGDSDDETVARAIPRLRLMRPGPDVEPRARPAWKTTPSTYVVCTNDGALPTVAQREMAARADEVIEWPTDHSPFLTRPREVAELLASYL
jgi:pimeloyl-ACP methyl ester carboxylesterase